MSKKIDSTEFTSLFILTFLSSSIGLSLYTTIKYASINSYIGVLISFITSIIPLLIFIFILNYKQEQNIKEKINHLYGKYLGTIINYTLIRLFFIVAITVLFNLSNFIVSQYLSDTNILYIMILLSVTLYFSLNKGIETISRISSIFTLIFLILLIIAIFSVKKEIDINNLKPFLEDGINGPIKAGLINSLLTIIPCFSLLIIPKQNITNNNKVIKHIIIGYIISSIILFLISIISNSILGEYLIQIYQYPAYISLKKASLFNFIDKIENFFSLAWILSSFIGIITSLYYIKETITKSNKQIINIPLIIILVIVSYKLFKNNTIFDNYIIKYYPINLLSILIIFIIISITIIIRKILKKD